MSIKTEEVSAEEIEALRRESERACHALMNGDPSVFDALITQQSDFTIFGPMGGPQPLAGSAEWRKTAPAASKLFKAGKATVEVFQAYSSCDLLALVLLEHQSVQFNGDAEAQNWSQRVTQIYRREQGGWRIVHRHTDPLTRRRTLDEGKAIARD